MCTLLTYMNYCINKLKIDYVLVIDLVMTLVLGTFKRLI